MNIIITGASRGIGHAVARKFSEAGHSILAISRNAARLEELVQMCKNANPDSNLRMLVYDLSDLSGNLSAFKDLMSGYFTHIDILINNAGYLVNKPFDRLQPEDVGHSMEVNFSAPFFGIQALMPLLCAAENPHVVNIGSMGGLQGSRKYPGLAAYSSSKGALATLTECLAEEYMDEGIRFNYLALGAVQTEMLAEAFPGYKAPLAPGEMASFITDFALTGHRYFNGKILPVALNTP